LTYYISHDFSLFVGTSVSNLKAMFEKKPAENPFPALKKAGSTPVGPTKAEEKKVEQPPPQSVSNLKSVFEKKLATTLSEQSAPAKCKIFLILYQKSTFRSDRIQ
jgi:hypothetical protein